MSCAPEFGVLIVAKLEHAVPVTLQASLIARLDRNGSAEKEIAEAGAAIGRKFSYEFLAATSQYSASDLKEALARLVEAGLILQRGTAPQQRSCSSMLSCKMQPIPRW
jgi:predicted ATPase